MGSPYVAHYRCPVRDSNPRLDLTADVVELTAAVCDIPSVSGAEEPLADAVEHALADSPHLQVIIVNMQGAILVNIQIPPQGAVIVDRGSRNSDA